MTSPAASIPRPSASSTRRAIFLELFRQRGDAWAADPDGYASDLGAGLEQIENSSDLEDWVKTLAWKPFQDAMKKRRHKPTRMNRDMALYLAAKRLVAEHGISRTRNDATRDRTDRQSAGSIICEALKRLGEPLTEKQVNAIVLKYRRTRKSRLSC